MGPNPAQMSPITMVQAPMGSDPIKMGSMPTGMIPQASAKPRLLPGQNPFA